MTCSERCAGPWRLLYCALDLDVVLALGTGPESSFRRPEHSPMNWRRPLFKRTRPMLCPSPTQVCVWLQAHAGICEEVYRWLERVLGYHRQLTDFLARLAGGAFIHASVESLLLVRMMP